MKEEAENKPKKVGGFAFFLSFAVLPILSFANFIILPVLFDLQALWRWSAFLGAALVGGVIAFFYIRGRFSVFVHELKHHVLANLSGNRCKGMKIDEQSGHFEYSYTAKTAHMNALIALAPYFFPLFFFPLLLISHALAYNYPLIILVSAGLGYGADCVLNAKDISRWQTDLTEIRGGFSVAVTYLVFLNLTIFTFIAGWVSAGAHGLPFMFYALIRLAGAMFGVDLPIA